jgi:hypothetical protein
MIGPNSRKRATDLYNTVYCANSGGLRWLTRYSDSLRAGRSGDRIPVWVPLQTCPGGPLTVLYYGYRVSFPERGVKRPGRDVDHAHVSGADGKERVELYFCSPVGIRGLL